MKKRNNNWREKKEMQSEFDKRFYDMLESLVIARPYEEVSKEETYSYITKDALTCETAMAIFSDTGYSKYGDLGISINYLGLYLRKIINEDIPFDENTRNKIMFYLSEMKSKMKDYENNEEELRMDVYNFCNIMENIYLGKSE